MINNRTKARAVGLRAHRPEVILHACRSYKQKAFPLLYLVVGEPEDKNFWEVKIFDNKQLEKLRKKHQLPKDTMEGTVSKKEIIADWEVVKIDEDLLRLRVNARADFCHKRPKRNYGAYAY